VLTSSINFYRTIAFISPIIHQDWQNKGYGVIKHATDVIKVAVDHLNPGQTTVVACDQPLFALAKIIQWKFVVMLGGLHIEMAALEALGCFMSGSGWVDVFTDAGLSTPSHSSLLLTRGTVDMCMKWQSHHCVYRSFRHSWNKCQTQIRQKWCRLRPGAADKCLSSPSLLTGL